MSNSHLQAGGTVLREAIYVARAADAELIEAQSKGDFCFVLGPRQIGKSSLLMRTSWHLSALGIRCVVIDLTSLGTQSSPSEWYFGLTETIASVLEMPDPAEYWERRGALPPVQRFFRFLRDEVLVASGDCPVVLFIDEIDSIVSLPFPADDFFAAIRASYNARAEDIIYRRLSFCLLGVASPSELIRDPTRTPFNIGRAIHLEDFTREEAVAFLPALTALGRNAHEWLDAVFNWTDGHPYMTQRLCRSVIEEIAPSTSVEASVRKVVEQVFLTKGRMEDPNLAYAERRLLRHPEKEAMLYVYRSLLSAGPNGLVGSASSIEMELQLAGMIKEVREEGRIMLRVRNLVFATVFDLEWVREHQLARRFNAQIEQWSAAGKPDSLLLQGSEMLEMVSWINNRKNITQEELAFAADSVRLASTRSEMIGQRLHAFIQEVEHIKEPPSITKAEANELTKRGNRLSQLSLALIALSLFGGLFTHTAVIRLISIFFGLLSSLVVYYFAKKASLRGLEIIRVHTEYELIKNELQKMNFRGQSSPEKLGQINKPQ